MNNHSTSKYISEQELAQLGIESTVYIKPVMEKGVTLFAVHNAAGIEVGVLPTEQAAQAALAQNDLTLATVH